VQQIAHECDTSGSPEAVPPLVELYRSDPSEFVSTRNRLVKELRAAGDAEGARELARRRKPTRAAHAANRLAYQHSDEIAAYLDLAAAMRTAQVDAARDDQAREQLRAVERDRRDRLDRLLARVPEDRDDVERVLAAALADADVATEVRAGTLEKVPDTPIGFEVFSGAFPNEPPAARERPSRRAADRRREQLERLDAEIAAARHAFDARASDVERAQHALRAAERELAEATRELERRLRKRERRGS
jgi:hypothetical protein